jgi:hemerythrin-like domain-containing protein
MKKHNPIQVLMDEHEVISSTESIIQSLDKSWEKVENSYVENVNRLLVFFKEYSDGYHHRKEEDVLFKELNKHPDFKLQDIITELEAHHQGFAETNFRLY